MDAYQQRSLSLKKKLADILADEDREGLGILLVDLGLEMEAAPFCKDPPPAERELLKSHPSITDDSIARYALTREGVGYILNILSYAGLKYLDHQASAEVSAMASADQNPSSNDFGDRISSQITRFFADADRHETSLYGVLAICVINAAFAARKAGLPDTAISRALLDILTMLHRPNTDAQAFDEETVVAALAQQLGVSTATARKYVHEAKSMTR